MTTRTRRFSLAPLALLAALFGCEAESPDEATLRAGSINAVEIHPVTSMHFVRPTNATPIDVTIEPGTLMSFGRHYFSIGNFPVDAGGVIATETRVERVEFGDVFAVALGGVVRRYVAIGVDAQGQLVALNQAGVAVPASELLRRVPASLLPHRNEVSNCVARVEAEASACVDESGSSWCGEGQAEAIRACMLDLSGGSQLGVLVNNELLDEFMAVPGALECETNPLEFVNGLAIAVNGEPCTFSGWTFHSWGSLNTTTDGCGLVADLSTHHVVCPGVSGGDIGGA